MNLKVIRHKDYYSTPGVVRIVRKIQLETRILLAELEQRFHYEEQNLTYLTDVLGWCIKKAGNEPKNNQKTETTKPLKNPFSTNH